MILKAPLITISLILLAFIAPKGALGSDLSCRYLFDIEQAFLMQHVLPADRKLLQERMAKHYAEKIDPAKLYLLKADAQWITSKMPTIFEEIKNKKCSTLVEIQKRYVERVTERHNFAKKILDKKFKFNKDTALVIDPDKRDFAKDKSEADAFQRKYIQFQVSNFLMTDQSQEEAVTSVLRGYERNLKRVSETKEGEVFATYLDAIAHSRDPHSSYFSKDVLEDFEIGMKLSLEGIGATLSSQDGFTTIEQLVPGGGAERTGKLKPKDQIIAVGDGEEGAMENVVEMDLRDVVRRIRGKKGTKVRLSILRKMGDEKDRFLVTIVRDKIKLEDEAAKIHYLEEKRGDKTFKVGVLDLPSFYADAREGGRSAASDMKKLLKEANAKNVDGLVLDLSRNGGGSLDDAVRIAGLFFKVGNVVKQSERGLSNGSKVLRDQDAAVDWAKPLVVLTSRISASASEIVSGALQDYKRAIVVGGDHTFGKGSVQSVMPLPQNLGALKITVGMFFIPGGKSTQHQGVDADIVLPSVFSTEEIGEKTLDFSLPPQKLPPFISAEAFVTSGEGSWKPVEANEIKQLAKASEERVKKDPKFKEIADDIKKAKSRKAEVKLAEVMKERDEAEKKKGKKGKAEEEAKKDQTAQQIADEQKADKLKEYMERADVQEAVDILGDYLNMIAAQAAVAKTS